ncbi:MAG: tRNA (adenosine(37)-N6)-threonylcarbamoyltransferase complex dimerization subunit type 1 TsaB [Solirubrobacterales bacterium]
MRIIGFDTATDDTVVAAAVDGQTVFESLIGPEAGGRPVHSDSLLRTLTDAAEAAGGWGLIDRIAVGTGPGTFTGIRIGLATANGIVLSTGIDIAGVSTLAALSQPMREPGSSTLALLDARRGEVFAALYGPDGETVWPPLVCSPDDLITRLEDFGPDLKVGGPGAVRFSQELDRAGVSIAGPEAGVHHLSGKSICDLGATAEPSSTSNPLEPTYLRVPDAQLWLERDGRKANS